MDTHSHYPTHHQGTTTYLEQWCTPNKFKSSSTIICSAESNFLDTTTSSGCTRDMKCHICKGGGHFMKDCPNKHTSLCGRMVSTLLLVIWMKIHVLCLALIMQMTLRRMTRRRYILMLQWQINTQALSPCEYLVPG